MWHPYHEDLFVSGASNGSIFFWVSNRNDPQKIIHKAHDTTIWSIAWHPLGHMLASGLKINN